MPDNMGTVSIRSSFRYRFPIGPWAATRVEASRAIENRRANLSGNGSEHTLENKKMHWVQRIPVKQTAQPPRKKSRCHA